MGGDPAVVAWAYRALAECLRRCADAAARDMAATAARLTLRAAQLRQPAQRG